MKLCYFDNNYNKIVHERFKDFVTIVIIAMVMCIIFFKGTRYATISGRDYEEINLTDCLEYVKGYETEDFKNFKVVEGDPQLFLDFTGLRNDGVKVKCIMIELEHEVQIPLVHVYYGRDTAELSEQDSEGVNGDYSKEIEICSAKAIDGFMYLRLDVDQDFIIKSIKVAYDYQLVWNNSISELILLLILGIGLAAFCTFNNVLYALYLASVKKFKNCISFLRQNVFNILKISFSIIILFCVVIFFEYCINNGQGYLNPYIALVITSVIGIIMMSLLFKDQIWRNTHIYYFMICMVMGTVTILSVPATVGSSADDEIHYIRVENLSWGAKNVVSAAASNSVSVYAETIRSGAVYEHEARQEWEYYINQVDRKLPIIGVIPANVPLGNDLGITSVAYIPGAVGLIIGRAIGLSYSSTFRLGKWMNLLCYAILFSCAIKITRGKGKILMAVIGMIPTSFFMACSYSYDWWVTSFIVFGYALFIRGVNEDRPISMKQQILIMFVMVIGILPKAIYFPLILPMLFVRKEKLQDSKKQRMFILAAILFLVGTFMLPILIGGAGTGDARGGSDVNSTEQIKYIIGNPVHYMKTLLNFLKSYLSPDNANWYLTFLLYYGQAQYFTICLIIIAVVASVDNSVGRKEIEYNLPRHKLIMAGTSFATISLVATSLYISFTAVGSDTIAGCQPRYILPVVFPFLFFNIGLRVELENSVKRNLFLMSTNVMMFVYLYGIYLLRVKYF